jgi:hypothetical protein
LIKASGINPGSKVHAHHIFPIERGPDFVKAGIDVNKYGAWWEGTSHLSNARAYNQAWKEFFDSFINSTPTQMQIYQKALDLKIMYGY